MRKVIGIGILLIGLAIGLAIGAAIPETIRRCWHKAHGKARESLGIDDQRKK